jgi:hypothetical protein
MSALKPFSFVLHVHEPYTKNITLNDHQIFAEMCWKTTELYGRQVFMFSITLLVLYTILVQRCLYMLRICVKFCFNAGLYTEILPWCNVAYGKTYRKSFS